MILIVYMYTHTHTICYLNVYFVIVSFTVHIHFLNYNEEYVLQIPNGYVRYM